MSIDPEPGHRVAECRRLGLVGDVIILDVQPAGEFQAVFLRPGYAAGRSLNESGTEGSVARAVI